MIWYITIKDKQSATIVKQNIAVDIINRAGSRFLDCRDIITQEWFCIDTLFNTVLISNEMIRGEIG